MMVALTCIASRAAATDPGRDKLIFLIVKDEEIKTLWVWCNIDRICFLSRIR